MAHLTRDKAEKHSGTKKQLIVILEGAFLETMKGKKGHELLNCDDHITFMKKMNKDFSEARPDITHQCLLTLLDSPLNKAGLLKVYIHTKKNVLIELNPQTRIPRTFKRFAGLMVQLLHEMKIRSTEKEGSKTLLKIVKNPVTAHLPVGCRRIGSTDAGEVVDLFNFVQTLPSEEPVVFVVGAYSKGEDVFDYVDQKICFSSYPLSASVACGKITTAFERLWDVL